MSEIKLIQGDFREILPTLEAQSIGACITDPPYPKIYLPLYAQMASELPRLLKPGGSLLAIVPHYALPQVLLSVNLYLKYRWIISMWQAQGSHPRMAMGVEIMWKPIVWWVNKAYPQGRGFVRDGFENNPPEKLYHVWEQSITWAEYCLKFTKPDETVLDPMMGTGTMGVICKRNNRNFIGIELDPESFDIAKQRIEEA